MLLEQFKKREKKIPDTPGVYFFLGKNKKVLYIGKATSLRDRVRSYFAKDLIDTRGPLLVEMLYYGSGFLTTRSVNPIEEGMIG